MKALTTSSIYFLTLTYTHEIWVGTERMRSQRQADKISVLHWVADLRLRDWVRSSDIQKMLRVELPLVSVKRVQLRWFGHLIGMPPGHLPFWACATCKRHQERSRACWKFYITGLTREHPRVHQRTRINIAGEMDNPIKYTELVGTLIFFWFDLLTTLINVILNQSDWLHIITEFSLRCTQKEILHLGFGLGSLNQAQMYGQIQLWLRVTYSYSNAWELWVL